MSTATFPHTSIDARAAKVRSSLDAVERWVEAHGYMAYEPFDGLSSPLRRFTRGSLLADRLLMQAVRQSPINLRPLVGIKPLPSTKGRGYMTSGYLTRYRQTGDRSYLDRAIANLDWLIAHKSPKFQEYSWANHFDFAGRGGGYSKDESIIVWTSLIGYAFIEAFEATQDQRFLDVAESACRWILQLPRERTASGACLSYYAPAQSSIHNANMLGAAMLARTWQHARVQEYVDVAAEAMRYTCSRQLPDGAWWYAEAERYHWIDNFHTGYNLDSIRYYCAATGDDTFRPAMVKGLEYYAAHFLREDGCPKYYHNRTQPIDSQCAAQSVETLAEFADLDARYLTLAGRVAEWTIDNMQARDGHFYYRAYPVLKAKAPMLHWAQATMYKAWALLLARLAGSTER